MSPARASRQKAVKEIVRSRKLRTQGELAQALSERGFTVAQATVSRDIATLELRKGPDGSYVLAEDLRFQSLVEAAVVETRRAGNQLVVITTPGSAPSVAASIDAMQPDGVLATVAGDDTVLVIGVDEAGAEAFQARVDTLIVDVR